MEHLFIIYTFKLKMEIEKCYKYLNIGNIDLRVKRSVQQCKDTVF